MKVVDTFPVWADTVYREGREMKATLISKIESGEKVELVCFHGYNAMSIRYRYNGTTVKTDTAKALLDKYPNAEKAIGPNHTEYTFN